MRIVLFAWCPTTTAHLDALTAEGAPPALVVSGPATGPAGAEAPATALEQGCTAAGVPFTRCEDVHAGPLAARLAVIAPDLLVIAGCPHILRAPLRQLFRRGAVNLHPSLLPAYRGREPLFWALLHGESHVGVTAHHVTGAVDAGPILARRTLPVPARATGVSLAAAVDRAGADLLPEIIAMARGGALPQGTPQGQGGSYFPPLREEHGSIAWEQPATDIDRHVRACAGHVVAHTFFNGMKIIVREGEPAPRGNAASDAQRPGEVLAVEDDALVVAAGEGAFSARGLVFLRRARRARDLADELGLAPGARLLRDPSR